MGNLLFGPDLNLKDQDEGNMKQNWEIGTSYRGIFKEENLRRGVGSTSIQEDQDRDFTTRRRFL